MLQAASPLPGAGESRLHLSAKPRTVWPAASFAWSTMPILDHAPELDRPAPQLPSIVERRAISLHRSFELVVGDEEIADTAFASRRFHNLLPPN
ncbi:hypothetical protein ABID26_002610 [Mesorhizobium shonense]|uniref:Uncharacterized protein n=2 Tax=Mesorhizobium shonense TaxID=1209948 RepID=A0ABV2HRJ2_9HYPH|nr:MAG: hypothetical protein E5W55_08190 [Mesorhizobium sp.]